MPLTRHLYREDEVLAALQFCVIRGRCVEAAFWAQELLDSQMVDEFIEAMRQIWLFGFGIGALRWYEAFIHSTTADELDEAVLISLVVALCRIGISGGRDTTFLVMKGYQAVPQIVRECHIPGGLVEIDAYFAATVLQGRAMSAWGVVHLVSAETIGLVGEHKHGETGKRVLELLSNPEYLSLAIAAMCLPKGELERRWCKPIPTSVKEVDTAVAEWGPLMNRRKRRMYPIPSACLYWLTKRGSTSVYVSNEKEIIGSLERPSKLWGSTYWDAVVEPLGGWGAVKNDAEVRETFYEQHFPDDIPDEWSAKDRAASHGHGAVQPGSTCSAERFLNTWFGQIPSAVIWNKLDVAIRTMSDCTSFAAICAKSFEKIEAADISEIIVQRRGAPHLRVSV